MNTFSGLCTMVQDCEVKYLASGHAVCNIRLANNTGYGDRKKTLWIRAALFGKRAESGLTQYLLKGQQVDVSGELSTREYETAGGEKRVSIELAIDRIELVGKRAEGRDSGGGYQAPPSTGEDVPF